MTPEQQVEAVEKLIINIVLPVALRQKIPPNGVIAGALVAIGTVLEGLARKNPQSLAHLLPWTIKQLQTTAKTISETFSPGQVYQPPKDEPEVMLRKMESYQRPDGTFDMVGMEKASGLHAYQDPRNPTLVGVNFSANNKSDSLGMRIGQAAMKVRDGIVGVANECETPLTYASAIMPAAAGTLQSVLEFVIKDNKSRPEITKDLRKSYADIMRNYADMIEKDEKIWS